MDGRHYLDRAGDTVIQMNTRYWQRLAAQGVQTSSDPPAFTNYTKSTLKVTTKKGWLISP
jgi:hypothetical protein